jgi:hypothetical protein
MEKRLPRIKALLTPGEVAKRSGVAVSALHFYESKGLIKSIRNAETSGAIPAMCSAMWRLSKLRNESEFPWPPSAMRLACCRKGIAERERVERAFVPVA